MSKSSRPTISLTAPASKNWSGSSPARSPPPPSTCPTAGPSPSTTRATTPGTHQQRHRPRTRPHPARPRRPGNPADSPATRSSPATPNRKKKPPGSQAASCSPAPSCSARPTPAPAPKPSPPKYQVSLAHGQIQAQHQRSTAASPPRTHEPEPLTAHGPVEAIRQHGPGRPRTPNRTAHRLQSQTGPSEVHEMCTGSACEVHDCAANRSDPPRCAVSGQPSRGQETPASRRLKARSSMRSCSGEHTAGAGSH